MKIFFCASAGLRCWDKNSAEALAVRKRLQSDSSDLSDMKTAPAEICANTMLCLINQASYLLHRQRSVAGAGFHGARWIYGAALRDAEQTEVGQVGQGGRTRCACVSEVRQAHAPTHRPVAHAAVSTSFGVFRGNPDCAGIRAICFGLVWTESDRSDRSAFEALIDHGGVQN